MKPIILAAGAAAAAGVLWYMKANQLGPWSPGESGLDEALDFEGSGLSSEDLKLIGAKFGGPSVKDDQRNVYASGIRSYMASWPAGGVAASKNIAVGLVYGGRGAANVDCGTVEERTQSAVPWYQLKETDPASAAAAVPSALHRTADGRRYKITLARGFQLDALQFAVYAPDAGRIWSLVQGYRVIRRTPTPLDLRPFVFRPVDVFVTPSRKQPINAAGTLSGAGLVFAWDSEEKRWLKPGEWLIYPSPAARIQDRSRANTLQGPQAGDELYGLDQQCKRTTGASVQLRAGQSRTKAVPYVA